MNEADPIENPFIWKQRSSNRQTQDAWERFTQHRDRIHQLLINAAPDEGGTLCVLGAGNCNDLDLRCLQARFQRICLIDLDREAMEAAVARQQPPDVGKIEFHAPHDLTGLIKQLPQKPSVERLLNQIHAYRLTLDHSQFDVVLSAGLLTQMFQTVEDAGFQPDETLQLVLALRLRHLMLLLELACPGGACVLVTDIVSTAPELAQLQEDRLEVYLSQLIDDRNFFMGTNPVPIWNELNQNPTLTPSIAEKTFHDPWLWPVTHVHSYLTYGLTIRKVNH